MSHYRPAPGTLESLRATLQKLEQSDAPAEDPQSFSELKRILLSRIADLELAQALEAADPATDEVSETPDLVPPASAVDEIHPEGLTEDTDLDKLN